MIEITFVDWRRDEDTSRYEILCGIFEYGRPRNAGHAHMAFEIADPIIADWGEEWFIKGW